MTGHSHARFDPVDTTRSPSDASHQEAAVESPSLSSSNALARFEFEPGCNQDGTKVLMVEWQEDGTTQAIAGDWEISWEGKRTTLPARDQPSSSPRPPNDVAHDNDSDSDAPVNRLYFLLGPGTAVPATVQLRKGGGAVSWRTNPLPAIFSPELGATARHAGKKGVLHTIWAKKRLQVLQREIERETRDHAEGIALEMAVAEKEWIELNFGVVARAGPGVVVSASTPAAAAAAAAAATADSSSANGATSPTSPRSPAAGRLTDKLRGLRIGTSVQDMTGEHRHDSGTDPVAHGHNPLSPEGSDMALAGDFGSFAALKGPWGGGPAAMQQRRTSATTAPGGRGGSAGHRAFGPSAVQHRQQQGMASLSAFARGDTHAGFPSSPGAGADGDNDDLFALPMSPRSPDSSLPPVLIGAQDATPVRPEGRV